MPRSSWPQLRNKMHLFFFWYFVSSAWMWPSRGTKFSRQAGISWSPFFVLCLQSPAMWYVLKTLVSGNKDLNSDGFVLKVRMTRSEMQTAKARYIIFSPQADPYSFQPFWKHHFRVVSWLSSFSRLSEFQFFMLWKNAKFDFNLQPLQQSKWWPQTPQHYASAAV